MFPLLVSPPITSWCATSILQPCSYHSPACHPSPIQLNCPLIGRRCVGYRDSSSIFYSIEMCSSCPRTSPHHPPLRSPNFTVVLQFFILCFFCLQTPNVRARFGTRISNNIPRLFVKVCLVVFVYHTRMNNRKNNSVLCLHHLVPTAYGSGRAEFISHQVTHDVQEIGV